VNKIIKILIFSDFIIMSGLGLVSPIFAIFITDHIIDGSLVVVGIASAIYLISKSLFQLVVAQRLDKIRGEKDDFSCMVLGSFLFSLVPFLYLICYLPIHLYLVQLIYGIGAALSYPGWCAIFTRHVDGQRTAFSWSTYDALTGIGAAVAAPIGAVVADHFGFSALFCIVGIMSIVGSVSLIYLRRPLKLQ